jgi:hypothetical protein
VDVEHRVARVSPAEVGPARPDCHIFATQSLAIGDTVGYPADITLE